jgi:hypothetical protein
LLEQDVEEAEPYTGDQYLGIDKAYAKIEKCSRSTLHDLLGDGKGCRPALKSLIGKQPIACGRPAVAPR